MSLLSHLLARLGLQLVLQCGEAERAEGKSGGGHNSWSSAALKYSSLSALLQHESSSIL